ncbi:ectoine synthase [Paenibacillus melissococcoides]|uniref:L-ectoine synthase n=1 Tax=Paenibacillus melissococcoides TaxID=2912268 RepID=A0ABM9G7P0_9BACL|nr:MULTISPECIES: ectoine synthase [Paenibacillus]MEB9893914.1 ectoine synthase [Bacillus cereus]MBG9794029.1 L-ectoine synthase [Paenibacillus dendritiformis]CAH8247967.1 ectoine synthase [Paenibacillus melissococcoides]CAH8719008.1 ectoine synthase [Paenibacillus melissococcoides]CAH8720015.1 ectoine synthase [Paenibacillus melissococcoides]
MIVKQLSDILGTEQDVKAETWNSRRLLLKKDGVGFSLHDTLIKAGTETEIWYKHHVEAVYCIEGEGEIEVVESGAVYPIQPGTLYVLDGHEKHLLRGKSQMRMLCVFNPPCTGNEVHDAEGAYPLEV